MRTRSRRIQVGVTDLAADLGLSTATVSRALNGSPAVRPEVARRVREHAERRGYVANRLARTLASGTARSFAGFVIPYVENPAYPVSAAECARVFGRAGMQVILGITEDDPERELAVLRDLVGSRAAGVIIAPSPGMLPAARKLLEEMPAVELQRTAGLPVPRVLCDDERALAEATGHLVSLGHERIAYLGTYEMISNGAARLRGYRQGLAAAGLAFDAGRVRLAPPTVEDGRRATLDLLNGRLTALVAGGANLSLGAAHALREKGVALPGELSFVVYGDPSWSALYQPQLTTIAVPYQQMADVAVTLLRQLICQSPPGQGRGSPGMPRTQLPGPQLLSAELLVRGSTGPPPAEEGRTP